MSNYENLYAEFSYDLKELSSFVKVLLGAAENEDCELTHKDVEHNIEIVYEKLTKLTEKLNLLSDKIFIKN